MVKADMTSISLDIIFHDAYPTFKPVKKKRRKLGPDRAQAINDEVEQILHAGSITNVKYPDWLATSVVVKKLSNNYNLIWQPHQC